ncbi:MAG: SPOR domain-containing protein [Rhodovulum sp.]|nr:SPOR domain-containing protein [Rhodovulum sp.]
MADERYRRTDGAAATARGTARPDPASDPLVELARLIGQNDPVSYQSVRSPQPHPEGERREPRFDRGATVPRRADPAPRPAAPGYSEAGYPDSGYPDSRYPDPRSTDPRYPDAAYDDPRAGPYEEPAFGREPRQPDQRYDGYTEPPRSAADTGRLAGPPSWLSAERASEPPPAEPGWSPPRPRDAAPAAVGWSAEPEAEPDPFGGRPLDHRAAGTEPMFPTHAEPLGLGRGEAAPPAGRAPVDDYDPRYAPAADGAYETGEYYDPARAAQDRFAPIAGQAPDYPEMPPQQRRRGLMVAAAIMALAVVGTAGAYGYRSLKGESPRDGGPPVIRADGAPKKIASASQGGSGDKQIYERVGAPNEKVVPREEQPVALRDPGAAPRFPDTTANVPPTVSAPATVPAAGAGDPKKIRTVTIRPDGEPSAPPAPAARSAVPAATPAAPAAPPAARPVRPATPAAPAGSGPMPITPQAAAPAPARSAMATPTPSAAESGNYVVQLSAQKTPEEARASFRAMQEKYPSVLSSRQVLVKKKDLGSKGIYYGSQVGPFASRDDAVQLCESLKAAGGNCIVQRN